jgi:tetratricopeptide (TPR) repeat protein
MADREMQWVPPAAAGAAISSVPPATPQPAARPPAQSPPAPPRPAAAQKAPQAAAAAGPARAPAAQTFRPTGIGGKSGIATAVEEPRKEVMDLAAVPPGPITGNDLRQWMQDAFVRQKDGDLDAAIALYRRVVSLRPDLRSAWANLGVVYRKAKRPDMALVCYGRALDGDEKNAGVWGNMGNAYKDLERFDEALDAHRKAVEYDPKSVGLLHNYGVCLAESGRPDLSREVFNKVLEMQPDHIDAHWDRSMSSLKLADFSKPSWDDYEWRWRLSELANYRPPTTAPLWRGEPLNGRTLLVYAEQGFGDTLFALRYLHKLKGLDGKIIFRCQPDLMRLVGEVADFCDLASAKAAPPPHDLAAPIMSLIGYFTRSVEDIPPPPKLVIPAGAGAKALPRLRIAGDKLKVGIIWSGSITFRGNHRRAVPLDRFLRFAEIPDVQLFSLQKGPPYEEYRRLQPHPLIVDLGSYFDDFADTAAVLKQLDLVLMTDSSVAHLAGSLGVKVWDLLNYNSYWIYFVNREDCPWYPSVRLLRQPRHGDWEGLFERIAGELATLAAETRRQRQQKAGA